MLEDFTAMLCFYVSGDFEMTEPKTCTWQPKLNYFWGILPYWVRMMQCLRRYYENKKNTYQLFNA